MQPCRGRAVARRGQHRSARWRWVATCGMAIALACGSRAMAQLPWPWLLAKDNPALASSNRVARRDAIQAIPWTELDEPTIDKVNSVLDDVAIYRRLPQQEIVCDKELCQFLIENPDLVVNVWEVLGISSVALQRLEDGSFAANDGEGTRGRVEYVYAGDGIHVVYAEGKYDGPLFHRPVRGSSVLLVRTDPIRARDGSTRMRCRLDIFVRLDHVGVEMLAKTFQPLVGKVVDHNFKETTAFMASLSYTATANPPKVQRIGARLDRVPREVRDGFLVLCDQIAAEESLAGRDPEQAAHLSSDMTDTVRVSDGERR